MKKISLRMRRSLSLRQTFWVLVLTMLTGLITSSVRMTTDYYRDQEFLKEHIEQLFIISEASAAQSLYHLDIRQGERIADGLFSLPIIGRVRLVDDFGMVFVQRERGRTDHALTPLIVKVIQPAPFRHALVFTPANTAVGYIEIELDAHPIFMELFRRSALAMMMDFIQYLTMAAILAYIFYRTLSRPLLRMTGEIATIHPSRPGGQRITIPHGNEKNELGQLTETINDILSRLQTLNQELEQRVEERTADLSREREQLLSIFDSIDEVIYVTDPSNHEILFVNQAFKELWGDATGKKCHEIIHGRQIPCIHCTSLTPLSPEFSRAGAPETHEFFNPSSQNWFRCLNRSIRWPDGRMVRYEMAFDITLQKDAENILKERSDELEKINQELTDSIKALQSAREQLVQSEKMASLGSLVAGISHEINTPIGNSITAATFLSEKTRHILHLFSGNELRQSDFRAFMDTAKEATEILQSNLKRAADLIASFKQVAVDQTSNQCRHFRLKAHLEDILLSLSPRLRHTRQKVFILCREDLMLFQNPGAISQIVTNLILNSVTHAFDPQNEGEIHFDIHTSGDMVEIIYRDNGRGVSPQTLRHIFDPFYTTARGEGGTGLGMHITFNLVTQTLKGSISCESPENGGIRFLIRFPVSIEQEQSDGLKTVTPENTGAEIP
ncbi:PAS domain-containing protein [Desulfobotulus alkaliphilus]|uniref:histidine kinase n=1 Tax=Desulfobotulus alkaliphilus TaxID=622671 RepID=A0A562S7I7_9BACT|nr:ATP-binding protein [Desulfobotulus alkaliphilus]TWI77357.1 PAS domain-containing protein [Desulfobotulus alkaliphilus]